MLSPVLFPPARNCSTLEDPEHGSVNQDGNSPGSVATYRCDIDGAITVRVCNSNGQWTDVAPTCQGKSL